MGTNFSSVPYTVPDCLGRLFQLLVSREVIGIPVRSCLELYVLRTVHTIYSVQNTPMTCSGTFNLMPHANHFKLIRRQAQAEAIHVVPFCLCYDDI